MSPAALKLVWTLGFSPLAVPAELALHEGSHVAMARALGRRAYVDVLVPHPIPGGWELAHTWIDPRRWSARDQALIAAAPMIVDAVGMVLLSWLRGRTELPWLWGLLTALEGMMAVDLFNHFRTLAFSPRELGADSKCAVDGLMDMTGGRMSDGQLRTVSVGGMLAVLGAFAGGVLE